MSKSQALFSKGFTIVELLIVIVVIAILAVISVVAYNGIQNSANESAARASLRDNFNKIALYHAEEGVYPANTTTSLTPLNLNVTRGAFGAGTNHFLYCTTPDRSMAALAGRVAGTNSPVAYTSIHGLKELPEWGSSNQERCRLALDLPSDAPISELTGKPSGSTWAVWTGAN